MQFKHLFIVKTKEYKISKSTDLLTQKKSILITIINALAFLMVFMGLLIKKSRDYQRGKFNKLFTQKIKKSFQSNKKIRLKNS